MVEFFRGDAGPLRFVVASGGQALDLSGASAVFLVAPGRTLSVTVQSAVSGALEYAIRAADWPTVGLYMGQLRVSLADGLTTHTSVFPVTVLPTL